MMTSLDSLPIQSQISIPEQLQTSLTDIIHQIQIESDFCIRHPNYQPLQPPSEIAERFQQLPSDLQDKYLSLQLRSFLYGIYYNASLQQALAIDANSDDLALHQNLENNTFLGVDIGFYERLHESNCGEGHFDSGWQILREESDGSVAVTKGGLTLHIEREQHLQPDARSAAIGDIVAVRLPKNRVQNGFYVAIANVGSNHHVSSDREIAIVRIYFNLRSEGAAAVMSSLTQQLNHLGLPFSFKTLYNPANYDRYDSAVLYFDRNDYNVVLPVLQTVYAENRSYFQPEVPLFTKTLAPGLALAEEPDHKFETEESFGMNRCQIVANGLLEARQKGDETPESRMAAILQHFSLLGIEPQRSYLNAASEDIYTPLDV